MGGNTQLPLTLLNIDLNFGGVKLGNPHPDLDLCIGTDNEATSTRRERITLGRRCLDPTQPDVDTIRVDTFGTGSNRVDTSAAHDIKVHQQI